MVAFNKKTERRQFTINGESYQIPAPYTEGHTCSASEAAALNQLLAENVRNNFSSTQKKMVEAGEADKVQTSLDEYLGGYEFGQRRGGGRIADPVEREARNIGKDKIKAALKKAGQPIPSAADLTALVDQNWEQYHESWMTQAKKVIEIRSAEGDGALDLSAA